MRLILPGELAKHGLSGDAARRSRARAVAGLGAYDWYAEYSPDFATRATSASNVQADEEAAFAVYDKYVGGETKLGPKGERARCGWFQGATRGGGFTDPATPNYVCSVSPPNRAGQMQLTASTPGVKLSTMSRNTKIAIGVGAVAALYLLLK